MVLVAGAALLAGAAAAGHTSIVPAQQRGFPSWVRGPLPPVSLRLTSGAIVVLLLAMYAAYVATVALADELPPRVVAGAIVASTVVFVLGPPLFSSDVFGYIGYARLGALHGLDPYTHALSAAPADPVFHWIAWRRSPTPYGPLFTTATYALAPLPVPVALWTWKAGVAACALGCSALLASTAKAGGRSGACAAALFGLNPVVGAFAVAGAHNDVLLVLLVTMAIAFARAARPALAGVAVAAAAAAKATAGLALPFMVLGLRSRRRAVVSVLVMLAIAAAVDLVLFGGHIGGMFRALREEQQLVSTRSLPNELGRLLGFGGITTGLRVGLAVAAAAITVALAVRVARGLDWIIASGWATLALLCASAWLMPWYAIWALPFAAVAGSRRLTVAAVALGALVIALRLPALG